MSWYNEAIFYHIYPLGLTGAPKHNDYSAPVSRLNTLLPWIRPHQRNRMYSIIHRTFIRECRTWL